MSSSPPPPTDQRRMMMMMMLMNLSTSLAVVLLLLSTNLAAFANGVVVPTFVNSTVQTLTANYVIGLPISYANLGAVPGDLIIAAFALSTTGGFFLTAPQFRELNSGNLVPGDVRVFASIVAESDNFTLQVHSTTAYELQLLHYTDVDRFGLDGNAQGSLTTTTTTNMCA